MRMSDAGIAEMTKRRRLLAVSCFVVAVLGTWFGLARLRAASAEPAPFDGEQWIEVEIVSAPTESVIDGFAYAEDQVQLHSRHQIPIDSRGSGEKVRSIENGLPITVEWKRAERSPDIDGIRFHDLSFGFAAQFTIDETARKSVSGLSPGPGAWSDVAHDVRCVAMICNRDGPAPDTFLRARWMDSAPPMPVISPNPHEID